MLAGTRPQEFMGTTSMLDLVYSVRVTTEKASEGLVTHLNMVALSESAPQRLREYTVRALVARGSEARATRQRTPVFSGSVQMQARASTGRALTAWGSMVRAEILQVNSTARLKSMA